MKKVNQRKKLNYIEINNTSYGRTLQGIKIYYEGEKPSRLRDDGTHHPSRLQNCGGEKPSELRDDGTFSLGKNILEVLNKSFSKFKLILTNEDTSITEKRTCYEVRLSQKLLNRMYSSSISSYKDIKEDIIKSELSGYMPDGIKIQNKKYIPGKISGLLKEDIIEVLNQSDKNSLDSFIPKYLEKNGQSLFSVIKAKTQITTLTKISKEIKQNIKATKTESWWQKYISKNILLIQQGYIFSIDKLNVGIGDTKYPDFILISHDSYLEIMEIKKPQTVLMKYDAGRNNYYWDSEIAKAICQVENYIDLITRDADRIRTYIKDKYQIDIRVVRPRATILAGTLSQLANTKNRDDYHLLAQANKNISFITYDELAIRLDNYINVLRRYSTK